MKKNISLLNYLFFVSLLVFSACDELDYQTEMNLEPALELELSKVEFTSGTGSRTIEVACNVRNWGFEVENVADDASWITVTKDGGIKVSVKANDDFETRQAKITVTANNLKEEFTVIQTGKTPVFGISGTSVNFKSEGGDKGLTFTTTTNYKLKDWDLEYGDGIEEWLTVDRDEKSLAFSAIPNNNTVDKQGTITIVSKWMDDVVISVSQFGGGLNKVSLTADSFTANASDPSEGADFGALLDGNMATYWHTSWRGDIDLPHWLQVDLGEETTGQYRFYYASRSGSANNAHNPASFDLMGSTTGSENDSDWFLIRSFDKEVDNLPVGVGKEYNSPPFNTDETYRYIRIVVREPSTTNNRFWSMSEFSYYIE